MSTELILCDISSGRRKCLPVFITVCIMGSFCKCRTARVPREEVKELAGMLCQALDHIFLTDYPESVGELTIFIFSFPSICPYALFSFSLQGQLFAVSLFYTLSKTTFANKDLKRFQNNLSNMKLILYFGGSFRFSLMSLENILKIDVGKNKNNQ